MRYINLRNTLALLLSFGLGAAVLAQTKDAMAKGERNPGTLKADDSTDTSLGQSELKTKAFKEWRKSEKPDDNPGDYASRGLMKLDDALGSVVEQIDSTPMGGGPAAGSKESKKEVKEQAKEMGSEALGAVKTERQKLSRIAGEIGGDPTGAQSAKQFYEAATTTTQIFSSLQEARFPKLSKDVVKIKKSADRIDASKPLNEQNKHVENFFKESSKLLDKMSEELKKDAVGGGPTPDQEAKQKDDSSIYNDDLMPDMK